MNHPPFPIFKWQARRALGALAGLAALQIGALGVWPLFLSVAHYGYPSYIRLMTVAWLVSALFVGLLPGWRWFFFAATAVCLPRVAGIAINAPAHHLLFPWFAGAGLGLLLRALVDLALAVRAERSGGGVRAAAGEGESGTAGSPWSGPGLASALLGALLIVALLRAYARFYGVGALLQLTPALDREVTPGVSANYSLYLALLLFLNFAGPLLFVAASALYSRSDLNSAPGSEHRAASQLLWGLGAGACVQLSALALQAMGWLRLAAGAGDHWQAAGRLPGILTDSGASTLLTPFLVASLVLLAYYQLVARIPARHRGDLLRRYLVPALAAVALGVAVLVPISYYHGRAFFLGAGGALVLAGLLVLFIAQRTGVRGPLPRYWWLFTGASLLAITAVMTLVAQSSVPAVVILRDSLERMWPQVQTGNWNVALNILDEGRAHYLRVGLALIEEAPWVGHGINSFQIELPRFQELAPRIQSDNPAMLVLGLLSDFGVLGTVVVGVWLLWPLLCLWRVRRTGDARTLWLLGIGVAFLPGSLIGFHLVLAEFSALLFMPHLCALSLQTDFVPRTESTFVAGESGGIVCNAVAGAGLLAWGLAAFAQIF